MLQDIVYPYQNLSLEDIPGEKWKPVPGYIDYYEVSNYGRIKSLERSIRRNGWELHRREAIIKPRLVTKPNNTVGDNIFFLGVTLSMDAKRRSFSVGRLVYYAFVAPFDLNEYHFLISYKDGNGCNLQPDNLFLSNKITQRAYDLGRKKSSLSQLPKPVGQFSETGELIRQFKSTYEAGKERGFDASPISQAALGKIRQYKGYFWQYGQSKILKPMDVALTRHVENLPDEEWRDLPGFVAIYQLSSYGRFKRLARLKTGKMKGWLPEKLLQLNTSGRSANSRPISPKTTLQIDGNSISIGIARFVYYLFREHFDLNDRNLIVGFHDGNRCNLHYRNLYLKGKKAQD